LRFRPDDVNSKPTYGNRYSTVSFLLRVRKKNRIIKADITEATKSKCTDTADLKATGSSIINKENLKTFHLLKDEQINSISNVMIKEDSCKDNANIENTIEKNCTADNINNLDDTHENENSPEGKRNVLPTFDNNKYENLSQEIDYELPCLKILGKVETEFVFTSMFYNKLCKTSV